MTTTTNTVPPHTLTVYNTDDGLRYTLTCDGVTDHCQSFEECQAAECDPDALEQAELDGDEEPVIHGAAHRYIGNLGWSTRIPGCALATYDSWQENAAALELAPGTYRVVHAWEDGGEWFSLELADEAGTR